MVQTAEGRVARLLVVVGLAIASVSLGACTPVRMTVPSDVQADSEVFEAKGRSWASGMLVDESFQLGPFAVKNVDRSATFGRASTKYEHVAFIFFRKAEHEELKGGYSFDFLEGEAGLRAECHTFTNRRKRTESDGWDVTEEASRLACACQGADRTSTLELHLSGRNPKGTLTLGERSFDATSVKTTNSRWAPAEPVGFRVDGDEGSFGSVELLRPGRIWLSRKLSPDERRELACLFTGVLLHVED